MNAPVFILPTSGPATYRGKYPTRPRSVSSGETGLHIELMNGTRLWTAKGGDHFAKLPALADDCAAFLSRAVPMTAEQYERLREAAELSRTRAGIAGHGRRAELEARVRAMVSAIQPDDSAYAKRNAEARRREILAETSARLAFDPAKPFRVYNRGPWGSCCFDFPTLAEARAYLSAQAARRAFATSGAAPAGPHGDSIDPLASFIVWTAGSETLADLGWTPPAEGDRLWTAPRAPDSVGVRDVADGFRVADLNGNGDGADESNVWETASHAEAETEARRRAALHGVDVIDSTRAAWEALETAREAERAAKAETAKPVRRDNVEYHAGKAAHAAGEAETACPYMAGGDRAARWTLGFREAADAARHVVPLEMNWKAAAGIVRAALENGTGEGRRAARVELDRMAGLADERNAMAVALSALAIVANETAHCLGKPGTMARDEMDSALAAAFALLNAESGN